MTKESLKDKLDGKELDLSLNELAVVPVKELAALPRATHLDLSCNLITSLPPEFCQLTHLVKLDLSKNAITELPADIGNLARLQHLDLFANKLTLLPMGICHLKNLRWLDVRKNPLTEHMQKVAGDCLNDVQCKACAKNIVAYMKDVQSEHERQRQKMLQEEREREAQQRVEEEKEKEELKARKKAEKEQRKREYDAAQAAKRKVESRKVADQSISKPSAQPSNGVETVKVKDNKNDGPGCCAIGVSIFLSVLIALVAISAGVYFYCETNAVAPWCREVKGQIDIYQKMVLQVVEQYRRSKV